MIKEMIEDHPVVAIILFAGLSWIVGLIEHIGLRHTNGACRTWALGLLVVLIAVISFQWIGLLRWPLAFLILVTGSLLIARVYRKG